MDYSSVNADTENLTGPSPWASSPRPSGEGFRARNLSSDDPSSPTPPSRLAYTSDAPENSEDAPSNGHLTPSSPQATHQNGEPGLLPHRPAGDQPRQQPEEAIQHKAPAEQQRPSAQRYNSNRPDSRGGNASSYRLQAKINGIERTGRKDLTIRFDIYTDLPGYRTTQFRDVRRTHHEFERLAKHLISANPEAIVPSLPPSSTSAGVGTDEDEQRVKQYLQRWMNYICSNEVLKRDDEMVRFVEGDPGYSPVIKRSQPATGVRRKMLKQFTPPPDDTPELQEARPVVKRFYLGTMDAGQKLDKIVKLRRGIGLADGEFGLKLGLVAEQELHAGLKNGLRKLGRTIQMTGDLQAAQGTAEAATLSDPLQYHSADAFIVKETLTNRHILLRELIQAQQTTRSKLNATDRLRASSSVRGDKVDEAIAALDEAKSHEDYLTRKTQRVTANLVHEQRRWFSRTASDLRAAIRDYVIRQIEAERRALSTLENVRPDIRGIDASGGLSRLGREATPAARRASLMSSQGPKGDAWSGVQRRQQDGLNRSISSSFTAPVREDESEQGDEGSLEGRKRATSNASSLKGAGQEDDEDRVDAKNAASRLATSTF